MNVGSSNEIARHAWVTEQLANLPRGWKLLDAGAGEQRYRAACQHLEYVSQDFAEYKPNENPAGLHSEKWDSQGLDIVCDIVAIPRPTASFDAILCTEVLEHLPDALAAIREFSRLIRPGGKLLLTAPFLSLTHMAPHHYATGFNRYYYEKHLVENGFHIETLVPNGNYFELLAQEVRRFSSVSERYCGHRPSRLARWAIRRVLYALEKASRLDSSSSELGCYGLHVIATRQ